MDENDNLERRLALMQYDVLQNGPEEEFEQIIVLTRMLFAMPMAAITLLDGQSQWIKSQRGFQMQHEMPEIAFPEQASGETKALRIEDAHYDQRFAHHPAVTGPPGFRSYIGAALRTPEGTRIGTICAMDTVARDFSDVDGEIMEQLARITVANLELHMIASKDASTGAESRRAFMDVVGRELERHRRRGTHSAVLVCRVDGLKDLAAGQGREAANAAIARFADRLRQGMRGTDTLGRLGCSTFALLLADAGESEAETAVKRLQVAVQDSQSDSLNAQFGYATAAGIYPSGAEWIAAAERASRSSERQRREARPQDPTHPGIGPRWIN